MINLDPAILAALDNNTEYCHLVEFDFTPTPLRLTDAPFNVSDVGVTYLGNGLLTALDDVNAKVELTVGTIKIGLSGVDQTVISLLLNNSQINRPVSIKRAYLNNSGGLLGSPLEIWTGYITGKNISEGRSASVSLSCASEWADYQKTIGRRTTAASQHKHFPNDSGLDFVGAAKEEYTWGAKV